MGILTLIIGGCASAHTKHPSRAGRGPLAGEAARLAAARVLRVERDKQRAGLEVTVRSTRCFESAATTYTCYALASTKSRPGKGPNFLGEISLWTVTVAVGHPAQGMYVVRVAEGLEAPHGGREQ
jgi:hypothetical protein